MESGSKLPCTSLHFVPGTLQSALSHSIFITNCLKKKDLRFRWLETGSWSPTSRWGGLVSNFRIQSPCLSLVSPIKDAEDCGSGTKGGLETACLHRIPRLAQCLPHCRYLLFKNKRHWAVRKSQSIPRALPRECSFPALSLWSCLLKWLILDSGPPHW